MYGDVVNTNTDTMGEEISSVFESEENRSHYQLEPNIGTTQSYCSRIYFIAGEPARPDIKRVSPGAIRASYSTPARTKTPSLWV